jgi:hypothetical protein
MRGVARRDGYSLCLQAAVGALDLIGADRVAASEATEVPRSEPDAELVDLRREHTSRDVHD